jgi:hypothetical protein
MENIDSSVCLIDKSCIPCSGSIPPLDAHTASELLAKIYDQNNQLDSAYKYLKLSNVIKDELSDK